MPALSVEYIQSLGACWSPAQLAEAALSWPSPNPSWSWFLGERLQPLTRSAALLRVQVALAHVVVQQMTAPKSPREVFSFCRTCTDPKFVAVCQAFGAWLDAPDATTLAAFASTLV
jgi:soluble lytic murein transglycosylase-like protein